MTFRDATRDDFESVLRLNAESVQFLSPLGAERLQLLHGQSAYHRVLEEGGGVRAFLLAFREGAGYDSPNYGWFNERYPRFLYIDRVVVDPSQQGRGIGKRFYADLIAFARSAGVERVTCEFDIDPPNEPSRRFHAGLGFEEVGTQFYGSPRKQVSLQSLTVGL
jgi:uncharacterized protein